MNFIQALKYPFQGPGWFGRLFTLALIQLVPIAGQLILIGYGLEVVRAVHAGQLDLPRLDWSRALVDGLRLAAAGLLYLIPVAAVVPMILTAGSGSGGSFIWVTISILIVLAALRGVVKRVPKLRMVITGVSGIGMVFLIGFNLSQLGELQSAINPANITLNGVSILLLSVLSIMIFLIFNGLLVAGARYALEGRGLLEPTKTAQRMMIDRRQTGSFMLNIAAMTFLSIFVIALGLALFVLPGLFLTAAFSLALWRLVAQYAAVKILDLQKSL